MKYKVELRKDYKKVFTIEELEKVREHSKEADLQECIQNMIDVLCGSCGELLKYNLTWELNRMQPENTFFGDGIEIMIEAWIFDTYEQQVRHTFSCFWNICGICNDHDRKTCGYVVTYKEQKTHIGG